MWGKKHRLVLLTDCDSFGEQGFLDKKTHGSSAVVVESSVLWILPIGEQGFGKIIKEHPQLALKIMR